MLNQCLWSEILASSTHWGFYIWLWLDQYSTHRKDVSMFSDGCSLSKDSESQICLPIGLQNCSKLCHSEVHVLFQSPLNVLALFIIHISCTGWENQNRLNRATRSLRCWVFRFLKCNSYKSCFLLEENIFCYIYCNNQYW